MGAFRFEVMLFNLMNSLLTFRSMMRVVGLSLYKLSTKLRRLVVILSKNAEQRMVQMENVFEILKDNG